MLGEATQALVGPGHVAPSFATPQDQWTWVLTQIADLRSALFEQRNTIELQGGQISEARLVELREALQLPEYGDHGRYVWAEVVEIAKKLRDQANVRTTQGGPAPYGKLEIVQRLYDLSREIMFDADRMDNPLGYDMRALARGIAGLAADVDGGEDFGPMMERLVFTVLRDRPEPGDEADEAKTEDEPLTQREIDDAHAGTLMAFDIANRFDSAPEHKDLRRAMYDTIRRIGMPMPVELEQEFGITPELLEQQIRERVIELGHGEFLSDPLLADFVKDVSASMSETLLMLRDLNDKEEPKHRVEFVTVSPEGKLQVTEIDKLQKEAEVEESRRAIAHQEIAKHSDYQRILSMREGDTIRLFGGKTATRLSRGWKVSAPQIGRGLFGRRKTVERVLTFDDSEVGTLGLTDQFWRA